MDNTMDWKKESAGGEREVYEDGTYLVECTGWQECESKAGTPQIRWFTEIKGPDQAQIGKKLVDHTALSSAALWRLANLVGGFGINMEELPAMTIGSDAFKQVLDSCVNKQAFWTVIKDEQYNNNKVTDYTAVEGASVTIDVGAQADNNCPFVDDEAVPTNE